MARPSTRRWLSRAATLGFIIGATTRLSLQGPDLSQVQIKTTKIAGSIYTLASAFSSTPTSTAITPAATTISASWA
jgi:hypothetical protein